MLSYGREMKKKNKYIDWLPSGIFSSHYLLERLANQWWKVLRLRGKLGSIMKALIPVEMIERKILMIHGEKVMPDADLSELYGVTTKRLNEQVKRNRERFPDDFMFQLTEEEKAEVGANCDHLKRPR